MVRENALLVVFYAHYLASAVQGDFGTSQNLKQPVADLLRQRAPITARLILWGTAGGWFLGGLLAWMAAWTRRVAYGDVLEAAAFSISGFLLAIPPAVLALAFFFYQAPLANLALSLVLCCRVSSEPCGRFSPTAGLLRLFLPRDRGGLPRW